MLTPAQIFDVVADINQYSKFVPFCECVRRRSGRLWHQSERLRRASRVTRRLSPTVLEAELAIGFKLFTERYVSKARRLAGQGIGLGALTLRAR